MDNSIIDNLTAEELAALEAKRPRNFCISFAKKAGVGFNEAYEVYRELRAELGLA